MNYNFTCYFVWTLTLISHIKGRKYTDRIRQEDVKDVKDVKHVKDNVTYGPKRKEMTRMLETAWSRT